MRDEHVVEVAIVGGGPAGLMAAEALSRAGRSVTVYEAMPTLGRKLLMAGRGGLNLTHSEQLGTFLDKYGIAKPLLEPPILQFTPAEAIAWSEGLGEPTFTGSSGRIFPKSMKASPLLRAWITRLGDAGVQFALRHRWIGWDGSGGMRFIRLDTGVTTTVKANAAVLALGGASWPRLGSDGAWTSLLAERGIEVAPLAPSNMGFRVAWSSAMQRFAGEPLKRIAVSHAGATVRGEALISAEGIEGGAVYAVSAKLRDAIARSGPQILEIDLRPDLTEASLTARLSRPRGKQSAATFLAKTVRLKPAETALLREAGRGHLPLEASVLARLIKSVPITLVGPFAIERAISSAGGVVATEISDTFMLRRMPGTFVAGEMMDWEAPTGGYLLQACLATGWAAGHGAACWLSELTNDPRA